MKTSDHRSERCATSRDRNMGHEDQHERLPSTIMTSGFSDAAFSTGPMTSGRYCSKSFPMILHILAQAEIMYETWNKKLGVRSFVRDSRECTNPLPIALYLWIIVRCLLRLLCLRLEQQLHDRATILQEFVAADGESDERHALDRFAAQQPQLCLNRVLDDVLQHRHEPEAHEKTTNKRKERRGARCSDISDRQQRQTDLTERQDTCRSS